jgi:hypothetical protein
VVVCTLAACASVLAAAGARLRREA